MKVSEILKRTSVAVPQSETWGGLESYGAHGIKPKTEVKRALFCVTPTSEVVEYFFANKYDVLISHHPFVKLGVPMLVFHTALDCCKGGLNDMWKNMLGVKDAKHFDANLGWVGKIDPIPFDDLVAKIEKFIGNKARGLVQAKNNSKLVSSVVICTGLGGLVFEQAQNTGADVYITGELCSSTIGTFDGVIEIGHTLTETCGVNFFRDLLPEIEIDSAPLNIDVFGHEVVFAQKGRFISLKADIDPLDPLTYDEFEPLNELDKEEDEEWEDMTLNIY